MSFKEFTKLLLESRCALRIRDSAAFREVFASMIESGLTFASGDTSVDYAIQGKRPCITGVPYSAEPKFAFCGAEGRKIIEAEEILLNYAAAAELMSLLEATE